MFGQRNELASSKLDAILTENSFPCLLHPWSKLHGFRKRVNNSFHSHSGQALVSLLIFMVIAITVTSAATIVLLNSSLSGSRHGQGTIAFYIAESGIENALLRLLRNPSYAGETLLVGEGEAVIQVTQGNPTTILSTGSIGNIVRKIQAQIVYNNVMFTVSSWKEVY